MQALEDRLETVDRVRIFTVDLDGRIVTLQVNRNDMDRILERGVGFDGSSVAGLGKVEDSDRILVPIADSLRVLEFRDHRLGFFIGQIRSESGQRSQTDARAVLEGVLASARQEMGLEFMAGPEHEFFLLTTDDKNEDMHSDRAGYFQSDPHDQGDGVRNRITDILENCGVEYEKAHHEVTASQHEINLPAAAPLEAADRTILFKYITHKAAEESGYRATFMPKPFGGENRNAFHIHLSAQTQDGYPAFHSEDAVANLSPLARSFVGGILKYARETSLLMASTYNSYKGYVMGHEAPIVRGWGLGNRSSMVRVPHSLGPSSTRIELRSPDPAGNVYLQMAGLIAMGLQGIREELDCGEPDNGNTYNTHLQSSDSHSWNSRFLPRCMFEALVEAEGSAFLADLLGPMLYDHYMDLKRREWRHYRDYITPRELEMYLNF